MIKNYYHFLRLNSANIAAELCKLMIIILCLLVFFLFLSGCSFISYSGQSPDGTVTSAWGWKLGTIRLPLSRLSGKNVAASDKFAFEFDALATKIV